jgi:hypothetical protein
MTSGGAGAKTLAEKREASTIFIRRMAMNLQQKIIKPKVGLLGLSKQLGNVSAACKAMGYSK